MNVYIDNLINSLKDTTGQCFDLFNLLTIRIITVEAPHPTRQRMNGILLLITQCSFLQEVNFDSVILILITIIIIDNTAQTLVLGHKSIHELDQRTSCKSSMVCSTPLVSIARVRLTIICRVNNRINIRWKCG